MWEANISMDEEDFESVGEQLYNLIYPKHKESAGKLTGNLVLFCFVLW